MDYFKMNLKKVNRGEENYTWGKEFFKKHKALTPNKKYKPLSFIEIHSEDARKLGLEDEQAVKVSSQFGSLETTLFVTDEITQGAVAMPVSDRNINYLTSSIYDLESKEPDYNHTPVKIEAL